MHICAMLQALRFGDIFFIDEAHSLCPDAQQVLYVALDQYKAPTTHKKGLQRDRFVSVASFTLVLATNEPGRLKKSLRSRLERVEFDPYTIPELKAIAQRIAGYEGIELTPQAARRLAEVAQGSPRTVCHRLQTLQYHYPRVTRLGQEHIDNLLDSEGIDHNGLWPYQRHYLAVLAESRHGSCSLERFAVTLGCDTLYIRQEIEPYLVEQGFVEFQSHRGRVITQKGRSMVEYFSVHKDEMYSEEDRIC
jgi:Holliday junction resolvasome RuvABC ATP-dependent DNA helicase subunit